MRNDLTPDPYDKDLKQPMNLNDARNKRKIEKA